MIRAAFLALLVAASPLRAEIPVQEVTSPGGITAWLVESPDIPVVALEIRFRGGATLDEPGKEGAVNLMAGLLEEGAGDLDAQGFARARDDLAASLRFSAGLETVSVSARFLSETQTEVMALLRTALIEPRFEPEAIDRVKGQVLASIRSDARDPGAIASRRFAELAFPGHPYARPVDGTEASVEALTVEDLRAAHQRAMARDQIHVAAAGDISASELADLLDALLGDLPATGASPAPAVVPALSGQTEVIEFPGPQSVVLFGHKGLRPGDPDFFAAFVANERLGGGRFDARLMTEVREKRGLTYGIGTGLSLYDGSELIMGQMQTGNATAAQAIEVVRAEWAQIAENGISPEELDSTKRFLTGSYPLRFDSNAAIARILVGLKMQGYDVDYPTRRNAYFEAVTVEDVQRAARRLFDPEALSFVIVGQPAGIEPR